MANLKEVKKLHSTGNSVSSRIYFEATFDGEPTNEEIAQAQIKASYHPAGYGGPMVGERVDMGDGTWRISFACFASCD
jgi:hypothetical protein